ncbi:hypothetical protein GWI33_014032 [Rhynchophorus ferrugineus]|uniref:Uncharacterized protein n=1 Tax=Rhynchophorus ferrugineus TaxID=354439 RepID=A0A834M628_RHYFE|nr:hypothetical protein GWI33_014032 [Rhynchophorus ferrugineus]
MISTDAFDKDPERAHATGSNTINNKRPEIAPDVREVPQHIPFKAVRRRVDNKTASAPSSSFIFLVASPSWTHAAATFNCPQSRSRRIHSFFISVSPLSLFSRCFSYF